MQVQQKTNIQPAFSGSLFKKILTKGCHQPITDGSGWPPGCDKFIKSKIADVEMPVIKKMPPEKGGVHQPITDGSGWPPGCEKLEVKPDKEMPVLQKIPPHRGGVYRPITDGSGKPPGVNS